MVQKSKLPKISTLQSTRNFFKKAERCHAIDYDKALEIRKLLRELKKAEGKEHTRLEMEALGVKEDLKRAIANVEDKVNRWKGKEDERVVQLIRASELRVDPRVKLTLERKRLIGSVPTHMHPMFEEFQRVYQNYASPRTHPRVKRILAEQLIDMNIVLRRGIKEEMERNREYMKRLKEIEERHGKGN
jgi:hypothetical protein